MGRHDGPGGGRRGSHRAEPDNAGPLASIGHLLQSTVPKRVQPPKLLNVLLISGITLSLALFGYSTTQIYLRFNEPPNQQGGAPGAPSGTMAPSPESRTTASAGPDAPGPRSDERTPDSPGSTVSYRTVESSSTNFHGRITVTNTSDTTLEGWELTLRFDNATVTSAWDVEWETTDNGVIARQPNWKGGIEPGESATVDFTAEGPEQRPTSCRLNDAPCGL